LLVESVLSLCDSRLVFIPEESGGECVWVDWLEAVSLGGLIESSSIDRFR
jgi:hypothetical protein